MICIINYGSGNLRSIQRSIENYYRVVKITIDLKEIRKAKAIILPGVGAFGDAIDFLNEKDVFRGLKEEIQKKPTLGICLGLQLMFPYSTESVHYKGFGLIKGKVIRLKHKKTVKVPHTGWNRLFPNKNPKFYGFVHFNHSYYCVPTDNSVIINYVLHGEYIPSIIYQDKFIGTQFHPEKSGIVGSEIIKWFVNNVRRDQF